MAAREAAAKAAAERAERERLEAEKAEAEAEAKAEAEEKARAAREAAATKAREEKRLAEAAKAAEKAAKEAEAAAKKLDAAGGTSLCWDLHILLGLVTPHKEAGAKKFGVGDYSGAYESYNAAVGVALAEPFTLKWPAIESIVITCHANAALCCLKLGRNAAALQHCDTALALPGGQACGRSLLSKLLMRRLTALVEMQVSQVGPFDPVRMLPPSAAAAAFCCCCCFLLVLVLAAAVVVVLLLLLLLVLTSAPCCSSGQDDPLEEVEPMELRRTLRDAHRRGLATGKAPAAKSFAELAERFTFPAERDELLEDHAAAAAELPPEERPQDLAEVSTQGSKARD